jgi:hypothetical protein
VFLSIIIISLSVIGFGLLYRHREAIKGKSPYAYYGFIGVILLVGGILITVSAVPTTKCTHSGTSLNIDQGSGVVKIEIFDLVSDSNLESVKLVGPDGTKSIMMGGFDNGKFTLRSNEEVISYLNNPENNITVPTISGTKTVESVGELPFEYQEAPEGFINPKADIGNYDNASIATIACLYKSSDGFELSGQQVPAGISIPCNTPVLAQSITEDYTVKLGTSVKPSSGPNEGKILVSPVTLKRGEYQFIGQIDGQETVIQSFEFTNRTLRE